MRGSQEAGVVVCNVRIVSFILYTVAAVTVTGSRERNKSIKGFDVGAAQSTTPIRTDAPPMKFGAITYIHVYSTLHAQRI